MPLQHTLALQPDEVADLVESLRLVPGPGSPLARVVVGAGGAPVDRDRLIAKGALRADGTVNQVVAGALRAAMAPDEVLSLATANVEAPGLTIVRRRQAVAECTVAADGTTKLVTPLDRATVLVGLMRMLSGPTPDVRSGFHFVGDAASAFVLSTVVRLRSTTGSAPTMSHVASHAAANLDGPLAWSLKLGAGVDALASLSTPDFVELALRRLADAGHLTLVGADVHLSPAALAISSEPASASFAFSRSELVGGEMHTARLSVTRTGPYRLLHRSLSGGRFEWRDVSQLELRRLVAAMWLSPDERALAQVG